MAVEGYSSPPNMAAQITLAVTPLTVFFLNRESTGEWSSNHWEVNVVQEYANGYFGVLLNGNPGFIYGSYLTPGNYYDAPVVSVTAVNYDG